ncbi:MAG TPA: C39 family peptidase [Candidatus Paceibacterota bacterium]|nr:C39 family peptidase [Candidatus Paceibacterota bacterium]
MAKLLKVKPYEQMDNMDSCGPTCLRIILEYWGIKVSEMELIKRCKTIPGFGSKTKDIVKAAEYYGMKGFYKNFSSFSEIKKWLDKKIPVIVDWFSGGPEKESAKYAPDGHYSVVVGLDKNKIYLAETETGKIYSLKRSAFLRVWFDFEGEWVTTWKNMMVRQIIVIYPKKLPKRK